MATPKQERPWSTSSPEGPWDYLVIGSGMGGMTTAAILADLGKRVLVLEQHYVPGGFTHMFTRPGYAWDVGVHAVGEVTDRSATGRLLAHLTRGRLQWASLGPVYDAFDYPDGFHVDFPDDPGAFRDNLIAGFPRAAQAVDQYLACLREMPGGMRALSPAPRPAPSATMISAPLLAGGTRRWFEICTADVLAQLIDDPRLRTVLTGQWGYYGSTPSRSAFAIHALVAKHFLRGGYYPVGGAKEIARTLLQTVADASGWTRIRSDVARISLENGRAVGVELADGERIRATKVISATGVGSTVRRLLPEAVRSEAWAREVEALSAAPAHVCLYLGFEGDVRAAGAGSANRWFYETWNSEDDCWLVDPDREELPRAPIMYCSFPSMKDPAHDGGPSQRHTGEVVTFVPWHAFARWKDTRWKKRGDDYDGFKQRLEKALLEQFLQRMPELRPLVRHVELSTPISTDNFCRPVQGSIYGLEPTPARFRCPWLRPRAPIDGLYFSGSDVASVGVIGAMMGGMLAALAAEPAGTTRLMRRVGAFGDS